MEPQNHENATFKPAGKNHRLLGGYVQGVTKVAGEAFFVRLYLSLKKLTRLSKQPLDSVLLALLCVLVKVKLFLTK